MYMFMCMARKNNVTKTYTITKSNQLLCKYPFPTRYFQSHSVIIIPLYPVAPQLFEGQ